MSISNRIYYLDCLRILATLSVIVIHIVGGEFYVAELTSFDWNMINFYECTVRYAVPAFQMVTGALFLGRDMEPKVMINKYVKRIVTAFIFWSAIYAVYMYGWHGLNIKEAVAQFITGYIHMWFLFMIAGIYLVMPILRWIVKDKKVMHYFLMLSFLFTVLFPELLALLSQIDDGVGHVVELAYNKINFHLAYGNVFYVVLGYYLSNLEISKKQVRRIYLLGVVGFLYMLLMTAVVSNIKQKPIVDYYGTFTMAAMLESVAVFCFAKRHLTMEKCSVKVKAWLARLSKYSFGVYLVHQLVLYILMFHVGINCLSGNILIMLPVMLLITAVVSFAISALLHQIPILKKYVV